VPIMLGLLASCFPDRIDDWTPALKKMVPSYGKQLADNPKLADATMSRTAKVLGIPR